MDSLSRSDLVQYGGLELAVQHFNSAAGAFHILLGRDPYDVNALYSLALISTAEGNMPQSETYLTTLLRHDPKNSSALALKGQIALAQGKTAQAETDFQSALTSKENGEALLGLAQIRISAKKWKEAEGFLNRAVKLNPQDDEAYASRSRVDQKLNNWESAQEDINQAISLAPQDPWHYLDRARMEWLHLYKPDDALADTAEVLKQDPQNFYAHWYRAQILDSKNETDAAWTAYRWVLKNKPKFLYAYPPSTMLAFEYKDWATAADLAQKSWLQYPGEYAFPIIAALSYRFEGQPSKAIPIINNAAIRYPMGSAINEIFRFLDSPSEAFALNDILSKEKNKDTKIRLRFYQGCEYVYLKDINSARAAFQSVADNQAHNIPEIRMARQWLKDLGP
ncbi:MAG: tetratricopeptide repeat protein [Spirochaetales bacterium]|nr:tetratricopeptide repeat protein [Spirochaetales bacterium]